MDLKKIKDKLTELFGRHRIVFWNDVNADFESELTNCISGDVEVIRPDKIGQFKAKSLIEIEKPKSKFLVYSTTAEPIAAEDWLLDIRLYSHQFRADTASMLVEELGLQHYRLHEHLAKRMKFFSNKQRTAKLKALISPADLESEIDRKIIAVLVKAEHDRFFDIVQAIFDTFPFDDGLDAIPESYSAIEKMDMADVFWGLAKESFGYTSEKPSLRHFLTSLFVSDLYLSLGERVCQSVRQFILPAGSARNAAVCLSEWRDSVKMTDSYDRLSEMVAESLHIAKYLSEIPLTTQSEIDLFRSVVTFSAVEKMAAGAIKTYIVDHEDTLDKDFVTLFCRHRQALHWSNKHLGNDRIPRDSYYAVHEALIAAADFIAKKKMFPHGFTYSTAREVFEAYLKELHMFDRYYRIFHENAAIADAHGWGILKDLKERMENFYNNWFMEPLTLLWENKIQSAGWRIDGVANQYDFFGKYPEPKVGDKTATVFVLVSDALRYECAAEVAEALNGKYRFVAKKEAMLGVVPSYTALGMAALLPHSQLGFSPKGDVLVDGKGCAGIAQRNEVLSARNGLAIKANDLVKMTRDDAREMLRGKDVVYLYHDTIDAAGDDAKTEEKTFAAVRTAIDEICGIVSFAINTLNGKYVFITADHGFVYTDSHPGETERNKGALVEEDFAVLKKRYSLGKNIPGMEYVHQGKVSNTAGVSADVDMHFAIPKGMSLFYFTGGARYFHGGLSLQEVAVPVITVEHVRGKEKEKTRDKFVGVQVLGQDYRITTGKHRFEILQLEAVSDRVRAATFKIGIYSDNEPVSDIQTVTFESVSSELADRKKEVLLTLKNIAFSNSKPYRLVLRNADTDIEEQSIQVRIDRVFASDF